ncbi:hypothetical protein TRL7639_00858 [Falsiruegeria litorea R37]|uniref:Uncharacterized protein n=1 Tax=Falsiruegeria litorea R37 TaxID=1200284 RepID=A0A1Y5RTQ0_9RHOB|nr:hypothetical protein [Falsiruegeria litorea]SLN25261.1 hypothetical protein TRL7639_00858 [Falsiruegeria litorea R37]
MTRLKTILAIAALTLPAVAVAEGDAQTSTKAHKSVPDNDPRWSNWPHAPETQAGRSYSKLVRIEYGGPVERNFESGRR